MALSGKVSTTFGPSGHYTLELDWSATQNTANNTSTITGQMWMWSDSSWSMYASATKYGNQKMNGTNYGISQAGVNTGGGVWLKLGAQQSWTLNHNSDGTCSFTWGGDFNFGGVSINGTVINDVVLPTTTMYLDTIPRQSTISSGVSWTAGTSNLGVTLSVASSSYHHTLTLEVQDTGGTWHIAATRTNIGSSTTMVFTNSEITNMYTWNSGYENRPATLYCDTYDSSGTHIGSQTSQSGYMYAVATATSTFGTSNTFTIGSSLSYNINNNYLSGATDLTTWSYDFQLTFGGFTKTWPNNTLQTGTLTLSSSDIDSMYAQIPTANSGIGSIRTLMYYNRVSTEDGKPTTDATNVTANVDMTTSVPAFSANPTYQDGNNTVVGITGNGQYIVQNQSDLQVMLNCSQQATPKNHATISSYTCTVNNVTVQQSNNAPSTKPTLALATNAGSTLPANTTYYVVYTWTLSGMETFMSPENSIAVPSGATDNITITVPSFPTGVTQANVYVSTSSNTETLQGHITASAGTLTLSAPLVSGAMMPMMMFDMGKVNSGTANTFVVAAIDSRGNQTTVSQTFNLIPYQPPVLNTTSSRASGFDVVTTVTCSGSYSQVLIGGSPKNTIVSAQYRFKKTTVTSYPTTGAGSPTSFTGLAPSGGTYPQMSATPDDGTGVGGLDNTSAFNIQVIVVDTFGNTATYLANSTTYNVGNTFTTNTVNAGIPILFVDTVNKSVGINQFPVNTNSVEITGNMYVTGNSYVGAIAASATPYVFTVRNWSNVSAGGAQYIAGWQGTQYWGLGTDASTGDMYVKLGVTNNTGVWQSQNANLRVSGNLDVNGGTVIIDNKSTSTNVGMEIGSQSLTTNAYAFIDFHSGTTNSNDYDCRIISYGGTSAIGQGTMTLYASNFNFTNGPVNGQLYHNASTYFKINAYAGYSSGQAYLWYDATSAYLNFWNQANGVIGLKASAFTVSSDRQLKTNIQEDNNVALDKINNTKVYNYQMIEDFNEYEPVGEDTTEVQKKRTKDRSEVRVRKGLIVDETPEELVVNGDSIDLYAMNAMMWKAIQELSSQLSFLETQIKRR